MTTYGEARLEGYRQVFRVGAEIIDIKVSLGQNDRSTNASVIIADPGSKIGADLIKHTLENGGIMALPESRPANLPTTTGTVGSTGAGTADTSMTPNRRAFLDMVAWAEGAEYDGWFTKGSGAFSDFSDHPRSVQCSGGLCSDAAGRYQYLSTTWDSLGLPDFSPANQDRGAIMLIERRGGLAAVDAGNIPAALEVASYEWASLPPYRYPGQGTKTTQDCVDYFNSRLAYYNGNASVPQAMATPSSASPVVTPVASEASATSLQETHKGAKLIIDIGEKSFEVFHQGTDVDYDSGKTTLTGQGLRWVLNRRRKNRSAEQVTLKELAEQIGEAQGIKVDYQASLNPKFEYLDQTGLSDYQLLLREADEAGLAVSEDNGTLTIKGLDNLRDTALVLMPGLNLISAKFKDQAVDKYQDDKGTSTRQEEPKVTLDIASGQMATTGTPELDSSKDTTAVSGQPVTTPTATVAPGQDGQIASSRGRMKRVKGLPSTFVIPMSPESLELAPMDAVRTKGLPGDLSRVWMVDSVTHELASGRTTLQVYSPVEVLDLTPSQPTATSGSLPPVAASGYMVPAKGTITSPFGYRTHPVTGERKMHQGIDIANSTGTPILAANSGTVGYAGYVDGYGNYLEINHADGYQTIYGHLDTLGVRSGQQVTIGQQIATMGSTGLSTGPHLHWGVKDPSGSWIDPATIVNLPSVGGSV